MTPVVRGPLGDTEVRAWHAGSHAHYLSDRLNRILWAKEPLEKVFNTNAMGSAYPEASRHRATARSMAFYPAHELDGRRRIPLEIQYANSGIYYAR